MAWSYHIARLHESYCELMEYEVNEKKKENDPNCTTPSKKYISTTKSFRKFSKRIQVHILNLTLSYEVNVHKF